MSEAEVKDLADEVSWFLTPGHPNRGPIRVDPYPFYSRLRAEDPIHKSSLGPWVLSRYDDVLALVQNPSFSHDIVNFWMRQAGADRPLDLRPAQRLIASGMLWRDPPDHTRLRRLVQMAFAPSAIAARAGRIDDIAREVIAGLRERASFDLLHDFALKLPGIVICEMVGMPLDRLHQYEEWASATITIQEPNQPETVLAHADRLALECLAYFDELVEDKRSRPGDDILSALLEADRLEDVRVTHEEIVGMCTLLHIAGHETTSNVLTNGIYHLVQDPRQYRLLRSGPQYIDTAIDEFLRYDGSARNTMPRWAVEPTTLGDQLIAAGDQVIGIFGSAHRDPARFESPDKFDITRRNNPHIAFGFGVHYCLGARLARAEASAALRVLMSDVPELGLAGDDVVWRDSLVLRALEGLPVIWT
jgi:cytochrome P450